MVFIIFCFKVIEIGIFQRCTFKLPTNHLLIKKHGKFLLLGTKQAPTITAKPCTIKISIILDNQLKMQSLNFIFYPSVMGTTNYKLPIP